MRVEQTIANIQQICSETAKAGDDAREYQLFKVGRIINEIVSKLSKEDATAMMVITQGCIQDTIVTEPQEEMKDGQTPSG